jgi:FAD binding domain
MRIDLRRRSGRRCRPRSRATSSCPIRPTTSLPGSRPSPGSTTSVSGCRAVPCGERRCGHDLVRAADRADDRNPQRRALLRGPLLERRHRDRRLAAERGLGVGRSRDDRAGARLGDVYDSLSPHALTIPAGSCPSVGIAGLMLGGGLGILGRKYGLTPDQLLAAQVVLASGRVVDCDEHRDEELFW